MLGVVLGDVLPVMLGVMLGVLEACVNLIVCNSIVYEFRMLGVLY